MTMHPLKAIRPTRGEQGITETNFSWSSLSRLVIRSAETHAGICFYLPESEILPGIIINFISSERKRWPAVVFTLQLQEDRILLEITGPEGIKPWLARQIAGNFSEKPCPKTIEENLVQGK